MHRFYRLGSLSLLACFVAPACSSTTMDSPDKTVGCPAGTVSCNGVCRDVTSDVANCGSCGLACTASTTCAGGRCECSSGLTACPSGCADTLSDPANCGACGTACQTGQVCSSGTCKASCDAGLTPCGASCVALATSATNCGACGNVCGAGLACAAGVCGCGAGLVACGTECVDTASNPLHCGTCATACGAGQSCAGSTCVGGGTGGAGGTGGLPTGGVATGGATTGGGGTGGMATGGVTTGGVTTGGTTTGGVATGGATTGGTATGGTATGGSGTGGTPGTLHGCTATISDATLNQEYTAWKNAYVLSCSTTQSRVQAGGNTAGSISNETFSEGIGYGMLLAVVFNDPDTFEKLWTYYENSRNAHGLMNWKMNACTGTYYDANGASDGDLDTAMALVQADRRWGGYSAEATALLDAIRTYETMVCGSLTVLRPGDAWGLECTTGSLNPSYFSPGYYRAFAVYQPSQAAFWTELANDSITMLLDYQQEAGGALMGEWAYTDRLADTNYGYNACRTPWRVAVDYAWWGTPGAQTYLTNVANYVDARGGVANVPFDKNSAFLGPFALSGIATNDCTAYHQSWMVGAQYDDRYFQGTLRVLALALMAGRFTF